MSDGPLSYEDLANLKLEQEFTGEDTQTIVKRTFQDAAHAAAQSIVNLAIHCKNDKLRFQAAQYVTERVIGRVQDDPPKPVGDPFTALWTELVKQDIDPNEKQLVRNSLEAESQGIIELPSSTATEANHKDE